MSFMPMRVLWVKSGGLVPANHGGRIRSLNILKQLAKRHAVTVFTFYAEQEDDPHAELEGLFERVVCCRLPIPVAKSLKDYTRYVGNLLSLRPYSLAKFCRPEVRRRLRELLREENYDVAICDFLPAFGVLPRQLPYPTVLFTHNVEAMIWERQFRAAQNPLWKAVCWREYLTMSLIERRYARMADHVLAVSEPDRQFFASLVGEEKVTLVPTGVDLEYFTLDVGAEQPHTLVFSGSMDWLANEQAVFYFEEKILPRVRPKVPDVSLLVVGRQPSRRLQELAAQQPAIRLTGTVDDVRPYIAQGSVYVVPLLVGGGTRLKIFEAMAMGKAIVSTSIGAEGLEVTNGENIILADGSERFADSIVTLLQEPDQRAALGRAARRLVEQKFSWATVTEAVDRVLHQVCTMRSAGCAQQAGRSHARP